MTDATIKARAWPHGITWSLVRDGHECSTGFVPTLDELHTIELTTGAVAVELSSADAKLTADQLNHAARYDWEVVV